MHFDKKEPFWYWLSQDPAFKGGSLLAQGKKFTEWAKIKSIHIDDEEITFSVSGWYECKTAEEGHWSSKPLSLLPLRVSREEEIISSNSKHEESIHCFVLEFSVAGLGLCQLYPCGALPAPRPGSRDLVPNQQPKEVLVGFKKDS